ncbi:MAG: hypothetical protein D6683_04205 [Actinomyces sp.]|nr:MAG: hypothetical protein D6683_04205 [Actinomyces sp.]
MTTDEGAPPPGRHCEGCGSADCPGCLPPLDPPRHCVTCGAWLAVTVTPLGWRARCRRCGVERDQRHESRRHESGRQDPA